MTVESRLAELAPDPARCAERVAHHRALVLSRAINDGARRRSPQRPVRRWAVGGALAAAVAGALIVGPTLSSAPGPFGANALTPLAKAAERTDIPPLSDGRVLHRITDYRMTETSSGKVTEMRWEEWTRNDGTFFRQTTVDGKVGPVQHWDTTSASDLTPREIAALPTDPAQLLEALKGSEQMQLGAIIYRGYAPTKVWAAAIEAYGSFDGVQVRVDESAHQTSVTETAKGGPLTMLFDSGTGQLLGYDSSSPQDGGRTETMRVVLARVEDRVPPRIVDSARSSR